MIKGPAVQNSDYRYPKNEKYFEKQCKRQFAQKNDLTICFPNLSILKILTSHYLSNELVSTSLTIRLYRFTLGKFDTEYHNNAYPCVIIFFPEPFITPKKTQGEKTEGIFAFNLQF